MRILLSSALILLPTVSSFELSPVLSGNKYRTQNTFGLAPLLLSSRSSDNDSDESFYTAFETLDDAEEPPASALWSLDPTSDLAKDIVLKKIGLSNEQLAQLQQLSELVTEWNDRINLVSRKDCNPSTVFARHILPSIAACVLPADTDYTNINPLSTAKHVVDVGTGGGFPGLPRLILFDFHRCLIDYNIYRSLL